MRHPDIERKGGREGRLYQTPPQHDNYLVRNERSIWIMYWVNDELQITNNGKITDNTSYSNIYKNINKTNNKTTTVAGSRSVTLKVS